MKPKKAKLSCEQSKQIFNHGGLRSNLDEPTVYHSGDVFIDSITMTDTEIRIKQDGVERVVSNHRKG